MRRAIILLCCLVLAGCTPEPPWPGDISLGETITILTGTDTSASAGNDPAEGPSGPAAGMYDQLANWWNDNDGFGNKFDIKFVPVPGGATVEHSAMLAAAQSGDTNYDIYNLDNEWVSEFAARHYIRPLDGQNVDTSGYLPGPLRSAQDASGQLYALPFTTDVGLLYYRSDLVSSAQLKTVRSFSDLMRLAAEVLRHHPAGVNEGYAGQFDDYEGLTVNTLEAVWDHDPGAFGRNGTVADQTAVSDGLADLAAGFAGKVISPAETTYQEAQAAADFAGGKAVFMRNWPIWYTLIKSAAQVAGEPAAANVIRSIRVQPLPFPSVLGGQDLAVAASSRNPDAALKVIEWLTSATAERCLLQVGGFPATVTSAYTAQALPAPTGDNAYCGNAPSQGFTPELSASILGGLNSAIPRPVTPYYTEFTTIVQAQVCNFLVQALGGLSPSADSVSSSLATDLAYAASGRSPPLTTTTSCSSLPYASAPEVTPGGQERRAANRRAGLRALGPWTPGR